MTAACLSVAEEGRIPFKMRGIPCGEPYNSPGAKGCLEDGAGVTTDGWYWALQDCGTLHAGVLARPVKL